MRMTQIEQALVIAEEGSISRAARKLFLSQPNLSTSLRQLEEELGAPLFERSGRGVTPTAFGSDFLAFARPAYRQFQLLGGFCDTLLQPSQLRFSVASQRLRFASTLFAAVCAENAEAAYEFSFLEGSLQEVLMMVRRREAEIGLIVLPRQIRKMLLFSFQQSGLVYRCLSKEEPAVIVRRDHPLCASGAPTVTTEMLRQYPLVMYQEINYDYMTAARDMGIRAERQSVIVRDRASLYELLRLSDAYTVGTHNLRAYENTAYYSDIAVLRLSDRREWLEIGCISRGEETLSPVAQDYLERLEASMRAE